MGHYRRDYQVTLRFLHKMIRLTILLYTAITQPTLAFGKSLQNHALQMSTFEGKHDIIN